jgi:hypothetical protein
MAWSGITGTAKWTNMVKATADAAYEAGELIDGQVVTATQNSFAEVVGWTAELKQQLTSYAHGDSSQFDDVAIGSKSLTGTVEVKVQGYGNLIINGNLVPSLNPLDLILYGDAVVQLELGNAAITLYGTAVLESTPISTRIDGGEPISATYNWRSKGPWDMGDGTHISTPWSPPLPQEDEGE